MRNKYSENGKVSYVEVLCKGEKHIVTIDTSTLKKLLKLGFSLTLGGGSLEYGRYVMFSCRRKTTKDMGIPHFLHRFVVNAKEHEIIDHINRNPLDNRKCNLRISTNNTNARNKRLLFANNTSGHKGVSWHKGYKKWTAMIYVNSKCIWLGSFSTIEEAIEARKQGEELYWKS